MRQDERQAPSRRPDRVPGALNQDPPTGVQYLALRHLERIAAEQAAATGTDQDHGHHPPVGDPSAGFFPAMLPAGYVDPLSNGPGVVTRPAANLAEPSGMAGHRKRFTAFSLIGLLVLVLGIGVQFLLEKKLHTGHLVSYLGQAIFSIELSFLLNRTITWRDRKVGLTSAFVRFNVQKLAMTIPNTLMYLLLLRLLGVSWLIANLGTTAVFTVLNYVTGDLWAFATTNAAKVREKMRQSRPFPAITVPLPVLSDPAALPTVSIIIPCKGSEKTIRATCEALLRQDYPALVELILVGDVGDSTWDALRDITDPRLVLLEQEKTPGRRDPNVKRAKGLRYASGQVLALADSDIVMDADWLSQAVRLLYLQGSGLVAGGMRSVVDTFWGRFVDKNALAAKTPRIPQPYNVTAGNFGKKGFKPPITANAVFTRDLYNKCPLDTEWAYGYEDYEWFWRVARNGHSILYSGDLTAAHHHRSSFKKLMREYRQSSHGCARFVLVHRESPLAKKRLQQAITLPLLALLGLAGLGVAAAMGFGLYIVAAIVFGAFALMAKEVVTSKSLEAALYPPLSILLGLTFTFNLGLSLIKMPMQDPSVRRPILRAPPRPRQPAWRWGFFVAMLALGAGLRLWSIANRPGWQFDEGVYTGVATNLLDHGTINENIQYHAPWTPELYQPTFYFLLLGRWFAWLGPSIAHARLLGALCALTMLVLLWRLLFRLHGSETALLAIVPILFDGWLLYAQRISYIENVLLLLVVAGLLLYQRALDVPVLWRFAAAGAVLGFAIAFKYTATYLLLTVVLYWAIRRGNNGGHLVLLGSMIAVLTGCIALQISWFDVGGKNWWWSETLVQIERVSGKRSSGGTLNSPAKAIHLLVAQYDVFIPSLVVAIVALSIAMWRLWKCIRGRSLEPIRPNALLWSWMMAAIIVFGASSLRFPQYFALILVPMYAYLWTEVSHWRRSWAPKILIVGLACLLGLGTFYLRVASRSDNVFANVQQYAQTSIPHTAVVVADEALGDLVPQQYCREQQADPCQLVASYAITWDTYLQTTGMLGNPAYQAMMRGATKLASWTGFNGTVTVWKLRG